MSDIQSILVPLFAQVDEDCLLLTPNKRLSRFLFAHYSDYKISEQCQAWPSLPCLSFSAWVQTLWDAWLFSPEALMVSGDRSLTPVVLSSSQEQFIWQDVIQRYCDTHDGVELFNASATSKVAQSAWKSLVEWQLQLGDIAEQYQHQDAEVFIAWAEEFKQRCTQRGALDQARVLHTLCEVLPRAGLTLPKKIFLVAFDEQSPLTQSLFAICTTLGCEIIPVEPGFDSDNGAVTQVQRTHAQDATHEIVSAAKWAAHIVEQEPNATIGIVIPELISERERVDYLFRQVFEPQYIFAEEARHASGFNMSAGQALAQTPPIAAALAALRLNSGELGIEETCDFLLSPFIGEQQELPLRAMLARALRQDYIRISANELRAEVLSFAEQDATQQSSSPTKPKSGSTSPPTNFRDDGSLSDAPEDISVSTCQLPELYRALAEFQHLRRQYDEARAPSAWADIFMQQLQLLGWPGARTLDTLEYQQVNVWQDMLAEFSALDVMFPKVSISRAINYLFQIAQETQFQAQTTTSPVQVLGVLEAAGMLYDYLWVMNLDNEHWPPAPSPNALLPLSLQKQKNMPRASAERELVLAQRLTERFCRSAKQVIFSHALRDGDKTLAPSGLIEHTAMVEIQSLPCIDELHYPSILYAASDLAYFLDEQGSPVGQPTSVKGGTQLIKDQAACQFRAYAKHRLQAWAAEDLQPGLSPADRGSIIHNALEAFWKRIRTHANLMNLDDAALQEEIQNAVQQAVYRLRHQHRIGARLKALERARIVPLLQAWLALEKQRTPFTVVHSEANKAIELAGLPITIRYDRVDKLENNQLFIVDYKTGKLDTRMWAGERLDEPQVPIYCVANAEQVDGAAFGQINVDQVAFKGVAISPEIAPGLQAPEQLSRVELADNWPDILQGWRDVLSNLAQSFVAGEAQVNPKKQGVTCQFCHLQSLCRIKENVEQDINREGLENGALGAAHVKRGSEDE